MISMTKTRLGAFRRPVAGCVGSGATPVFGTAFGRGSGVRRLQQHWSAPSAVQLIAPYAVVNSTSVSAPPERSP
jgi:hypothetical protein